jgi:hypothetical protein
MPPKRRRTVEFDLSRPVGQCTLCAAQHKFDELPILFRSTDAHKAHSQKFQCRFDLDQCSGRASCTDITQCPKSEQLIWHICAPSWCGKETIFSTVWSTLLKGHTLVAGIPQSKVEGVRTVLEIRLITGERLVFDGDAKKFSIK